jgi:TolB protein
VISRRALPALFAATLAACHHDLSVSTCPADGYPASALRAAGCTPGPGWLAYAFIREGTSNPALFISRADGTCARRVTTDGAFYGGPAYFPGGQRLAYASTRDGTNKLYLLDLETGLESPLETTYPFDPPPAPPAPLDAAAPSVSPDGTTIAFEGSRSTAAGASDVFSIPVAGGNVLRVTTDPSAATLPRWSPDGSLLYFLSYRTGTQELFSVPAGGGGGGGAQVTFNSSLSSKFDVTTDGAALVYARFSATGTGSMPTELVAQDLASGTIRVIATGNEADPAVDATGTAVAVSRRSPTGYDLYLLDYQTGSVKAQLTSCPGQAFGAAFAR